MLFNIIYNFMGLYQKELYRSLNEVYIGKDKLITAHLLASYSKVLLVYEPLYLYDIKI